MSRPILRWFFVFCAAVVVLPVYADERRAQELADFPSVWLMNTPGSGLITMRLEFEGGSALDPEEEEGLTALSILALSSEMKPLPGSGVRLRAGSAYSVLTIQVLAEDLSSVLDQVGSLVLEPGFSERTFGRVQQQILSFLASRSEDHYTYSKEEWLRVFHGREPTYGTPDSIGSLTYQNSLSAAKRQLQEQVLTASIVGDLSGPETLPRLHDFFESLNTSNRSSTNISNGEPRAIEDITNLLSDSKETSIVFGAAPEKTEQDYFVGTIVAQLLGGSISSSRIGRRVRFEGGLAYIVEANYIERELNPAMMGYVGTSPKNVSQVVGIVKEEWLRLGEQGVTADELHAVVSYLSGSASLLGDDSMRLAEQMQRARRLGLGTGFATAWPSRFEAVSLEEVNNAVRRFVEPGSLKLLVLGSINSR